MNFKRFATPVVLAAAVALPGMAGANEGLAQKNACLACHQVDNKLVGPSFKDIAAKYKEDPAAVENLVKKVKEGGSGVWGQIPMPPNAAAKDEDVKAIVEWIMTL